MTTDDQSVPSRDLEASLRFERLLADVSSRFIKLPADQVDAQIETAQRQVCDALDVDRSVLFQEPEQEPGRLVVTHVYQAAANLRDYLHPADRPLLRRRPRRFGPWPSRFPCRRGR